MFGAVLSGAALFGAAGGIAAASTLPTTGTSISWTVLPARNICGVRRKFSGAIRLFDFDFARLEEIGDGDAIASAEISQARLSGAGELTLGDVAIVNGAKVKFAIAEGTAWSMHRLTCVAETALGRTLIGVGHLFIN
ncbi:MAG TPA: hypothetical protein VK530_17795 [Candidatus Acidoferrum sp.]|nr:hypothetical protein [Candidatus Acidoferrum sp.]